MVQEKYPTPDAYKRDRFYGSSWDDGTPGHVHYLKNRPHYAKHIRAMQKGTHSQGVAVRDQYKGQFACGGFNAENASISAHLDILNKQPCPQQAYNPNYHCASYYH